jgi:hypothetical protein
VSRRFGRRVAVKGAVAVGAVCALGVLPSDGGVEASGVELRPPAEGAAAAGRWRLAHHRVLRVGRTVDVVAGESEGLTVAVVRGGDADVAAGVEGGVDAPVVFEVNTSGARVPRPDVTARLRAYLERADGRRRPRSIVGPGRAEATHDPGTCAALLATAAALLLLCSRGQGWACGMGAALAVEAIGYCK